MAKCNLKTHTRLWCKFCRWSCPVTFDRRGDRPFGHAGLLEHVRQEHAEQYKTIQRHLRGELVAYDTASLN